MGIFSKEKLLQIVTIAKRHWWLFIPVLLLIIFGYIIFLIADVIQIFLLRVRNMFLAIFTVILHGFKGVKLFFKKLGEALQGKCTATSAKLHQMSENAQTARAELLQSAVTFCTLRHERRENKKAELREAAKLIIAANSTKPDAVSPISVAIE